MYEISHSQFCPRAVCGVDVSPPDVVVVVWDGCQLLASVGLEVLALEGKAEGQHDHGGVSSPDGFQDALHKKKYLKVKNFRDGIFYLFSSNRRFGSPSMGSV